MMLATSAASVPLISLVRLARVLGLVPFSHLDGCGSRVRLIYSRTVHAVSVGAVVTLSLAASVCLWQDAGQLLDKLHSRPSVSTDVTEFILNCFSIVLVCTIVMFTRTSCELLSKFLRFLVKVDGALTSTPGNPQRGLVHVLVGSIVWTSRAAATTWLFGLPLRDVLLFPLWFVILATEQLTVVLCSELAQRYRAINAALDSMQPPRKPSEPIRRVSNKFEELRADKLMETKFAWLEPNNMSNDLPPVISPTRIEVLREAHSSLADAFQELNKRLGVFMLLDLAYLFVVLLNTSISFLQHCIIRSTDRRGEPTACMGHALLAFDGLLRMTIITVSCGAVGEEAEHTAESAARLLRRAIDWEALRELQIFGAQVRARRVAFWACGLFTVDRPLLFSICGAITSYLFILSQLK